MSHMPDRAEAWAVLTRYNKEEFHLRHALTEESVMRWFATELGYEAEADFWALAGLLHDLDFERWPGEHCRRTEALMRELDWEERLIHAAVSHGYGIVTDVRPEHEMEKVLFATDELTGLIGAVAIVRPSRSVMDLELKSVKKKFKSESFAAGCSRSVIERGAAMLGWELDFLIERTILALRAGEAEINEFFSAPAP
ncbi:MAG: hydrolase [Gracilibacteraceae bacterium]|jgi:predicted hydrolase (HD superfamily)|nr:hydrolase [Gracilibacteraceae bacterium]